MNFNAHENISKDEIKLLSKYYNPLNYYLDLLNMLKDVYPDRNLDTFTKYQLHKLLNDTLVKNRDGEELVKCMLWQLYLNEPDVVGAFETRVNTSRVDFLTINGHTTSFEIKTKFDNLSKLGKQCSDYLSAFEYNYVVIAECHLRKAEKIIPNTFGIWIYENGEYDCYKKASLNTQFSSESQLRLLTKKELCKSFAFSKGVISEILTLYTSVEINLQFKSTLKERYRQRWNFVVDHSNSIFHMDVQFFFNTNIHPDHIYYL